MVAHILDGVSTNPAVPVVYARIPNALTILRFALVPVFIVLLVRADGGHSWPAGIVFGIAAITDQIDGWLARRWNVESEFGKYADPLADRLMIGSAVLLLCLDDRLPWIALAIVVGRDVLLVVGTPVIRQHGYQFSVSLLGKTATWVLYLAVECVILTTSSQQWPLWLFWLGVALAVAAGVVYAVGAWKQVKR